MLDALPDAYARRIAQRNAMPRCTDGRTDLRTKKSFVTFERKLTLSNAREKSHRRRRKATAVLT